MAVTRLGKCYWGAAEVGAVLKGVVSPSTGGAARQALAAGLHELGYDAPLFLLSQASVGLSLALAEMRAQRPERSVVVVPAYCCPSVPETVRALGLSLRAAPVNGDLNLDFDAVEPLITSDVLAVVGVHMYGLPIDIGRLKQLAEKAAAFVVDDAAHVLAARGAPQHLGQAGDAGLLSFHHSKTLTGGSPNGGGALMVTNATLTPGIAARVAQLPEGRSPLGYHLWFALRYAIEITPRALTEYIDPIDELIARGLGVEKKHSERMGAASGNAVFAQLQRLGTIIEGRRRIFAEYLEALKSVPGLELAQTDVAQSLSRVLVRWREGAHASHVREQMARKGFATRLPYPRWTDDADPTARAIEHIGATHLELPCSPDLRRSQIERVLRTLRPLVAGGAE